MPSNNLGNQYENEVKERLRRLHLLPRELRGNDAGFIHNGREYYLEVKNKTAPDFGQKGLKWSEDDGWTWREEDSVTDLYEALNIIGYIDKLFIPRRYTIAEKDITPEDRHYDQEHFENHISGLPIDSIYEYYARKDCYYIQIEKHGLFYLLEDRAFLGVPQFDTKLSLRFRAKTHHSYPAYKYSFFAVIQARLSTLRISNYDFDEEVGLFPKII